MTSLDKKFMALTIQLARQAAKAGEVPVGAVLVKDGKVVSKAYNQPRRLKDPTAHAEILALRKAALKLRNERLVGTVLYVSLEPCVMCAGAVVQARVARVVYGADDPKAGACGSIFTVLPNNQLNHRPIVTKGVLAKPTGAILTQFFRRRRKDKMRRAKTGGDLVSTVVW